LDVLDRLNDTPGLARIRISSIEPTTIPDGLFDRMNDPGHALVPYLHVPLQSGSNRMLGAMRRRYTREEYLEFVFRAHEAVPGIGIGTDIMVGFPGESDADFHDTCDVLWRSPLAYAHIFKYSEREGTASTRIAAKIPADTAAARSARLHQLSAEKSRLFAEHHLDSDVEVLFEHAEVGWWTGYSGNYLRVAARSAEDLTNQLCTVRLESLSGDLAIGALVEADAFAVLA
jgi:threonylcarbamoyladenosine tRNA methylthiotransferase MtaB